MRLPRFHVTVCSCVCAFVLAAAGSARAATNRTWDAGGGADGSWGTAANWNGDTLPDFVNGDNLTFSTFDAAVTTLDGDRTANSITFATSLSGEIAQGGGGALTLNGNIVRNSAGAGEHVISAAIQLGANVVIDNNTPTGRLEFTGDISGNHTLTIPENGTTDVAVYLSGDNSFHGDPVTFWRQSTWPEKQQYTYTTGVYIDGRSSSSSTENVIYVGSNTALGAGALMLGQNVTDGGTATLAGCGGTGLTLANELILDASSSVIAGETDMTFTGRVYDIHGTAEYRHLYKRGPCTVTFTATTSNPGVWGDQEGCSWAGATYVEEGRVLMDGYHWSWGYALAYWVYDGATFGGTGIAEKTINVYDGGTMQPGHDGIGTISVASFYPRDGALWDIEIGAPGNCDLITCGGRLYADGIVNITKREGIEPGEYVLATYDPTKLTDRGLVLGDLPVGFSESYIVDPNTTLGELRIVMAAHAGDANCDGAVNIGDLAILGTHYGQSGMRWVLGDFNCDGEVNIGDLGILGTEYGWIEGGAAGGDVPEPATAGLLALAFLAVLRRRRQKLVS